MFSNRKKMAKIVALQNNPISWALKGLAIVTDIKDFAEPRPTDWSFLPQTRAIFCFKNCQDFLCHLRRNFPKFKPLFIIIGENIGKTSLVFRGTRAEKPVEKQLGGYTGYPTHINIKNLLSFLSSPPPDDFGVTVLLATVCYQHYLPGIIHETRFLTSEEINILNAIAKKSITLWEFTENVEKKATELSKEGEGSMAGKIQAFARLLNSKILIPSKRCSSSFALSEAFEEMETAVRNIKEKYEKMG